MTAPAVATASLTTHLPALARRSALPRHVAIIMDGNRRWARARGVPEAQGHAAGVEAIRPIVEHAAGRGIEVLTIYAFSRENWQRSSDEVGTLFGLLDATIRDETPRLVEQGVRVRLAGPPRGAAGTRRAPRSSRPSCSRPLGQRMTLNVAFNYSSRSEIVDAVRAYVDDGNSLAELDEERPRRPTSTRRTCRTPTCSSAPAATSASATSCSGRRPTPSSTSATASGPTSARPTSTRPCRVRPPHAPLRALGGDPSCVSAPSRAVVIAVRRRRRLPGRCSPG